MIFAGDKAKLILNQRGWLACGLLVTCVCYLPLAHARFVYDDRWMLVENSAIRQVAPRAFFADRLTAALPESGLTTDFYRPFTTLSFALDYRAWLLHPLPYHLENLLLHLANGFLSWLILCDLLGSSGGATFGALLFLLHPLQVQTVAWVSQRSGLLSAFFGFSLLSLLTSGVLSLPSILLGWLFCLGSLFSKESGVIFPGLLWLARRAAPRKEISWRLPWVLYLGFAVSIGAYAALRWHALGHWSQYASDSPSPRAAMQLGLLAFPMYVGKMLIPVGLRPSYDFPIASPLLLAAAGIFFAGYLITFAGFYRKWPVVAIALAWIFLSLLPVLQLIPMRAFFADRFAYVAVGGLALGAGWIWNQSRRARWVEMVWLVLLVVMTVRTVPMWQNQQILWAYAVQQEPSNAFAHASYAETLPDPSRAIAEYELALTSHPSNATRFAATNNLSRLFLLEKEPAQALLWAETATQLEPQSVPALYNLCRAAAATGDFERARQVYRQLTRMSQAPPALLKELHKTLFLTSEKTHGV